MKHIFLLVVTLLFSAYTMAFSTWDGASAVVWTQGSGTQADPYIIESAENLAYLAQQVNAGTSYFGKYFKVNASIDLDNQDWTPIGATSNAAFSGIVDGNGKIIYNLKVTGQRSYYGLFGFIMDGGAVSDIVVENCDIQVTNNQDATDDIYVGAIAARIVNPSVTIQNCYATGKVVVTNSGTDKCEVYTTHKLYEGGLFGSLYKANVKLCYNNVDFSAEGNGTVGGIVGAASRTSITECYNKAVIRGKACHAGIMGESAATSESDKNVITYCYNTGEIRNCDEPDADNYNGGIAGNDRYTDITSCYTVGSMTNYSGSKNYAISKNTDKRSRSKDYREASISCDVSQTSSGISVKAWQMKTSQFVQLIDNNYYKVDLVSTFNDGYPINKDGTYKTVTEGVTLVGEGVVLIDATAYAHNNSDRGIWSGEKSNPFAWKKHSTYSTTLNQYRAENLDYDKMYGYKAYQNVYGKVDNGEERYFSIHMEENCAGLSYVFHGKTFTQPGYYSVVDGNTTYLLDLRDMANPPTYKITFDVDGVETDVKVRCGETPAYPGGTPVKPSTAQYTYTFLGWTPGIEPASADARYTAVFTSTERQYRVEFKNYNGTTLYSAEWKYGQAPVYGGPTPEKPATAEYTYTFKGWQPTVVAVTGDAVYTAEYDAVKNQYQIRFLNEDGTVLQDDMIDYGETPAYTGATPVKPATVQYTYTFDSWTPTIAAVTGAQDYMATYTSTLNKYKIVFNDYNGTELQNTDVEYGTTPTPPADPVRPATAEYTYTFKEWQPTVVAVTGDAVYTAEYDAVKNQYQIRFLNEDGTVLQDDMIDYGETPAYTGATPVKPATVQYTYTFDTWTPAIAAVTGAQDYTATYTSTLNKYKIVFNDYNGIELQNTDVEYGTTPTPPADPVRPSTAEYTYTFKGWQPTVVAVTGDAVYTAEYDAVKNQYQIRFLNEDGTVLQDYMVDYGETPAYTGATPVKPATVQYTYTFDSWTPAITSVTGAQDYTATYTSTLNKYKVVFLNYDGTELQSTDVEYGTMPTSPADPSRPAENYSEFTFCKWMPDIAEVSGTATYKAYYSATTTLPDISNCYSYTWKGQYTKVSTTLTYATKTVECDCDSIVSQYIEILDSTVVTLHPVSDCEQYTWEGQTTYESTTLRKVDVGKNGCDSITYQPVIIYDKSEVFITDTVTPGVAYKRNGFDLEPINELGEYEFVNEDKSIYGCDSTTYLTLEVVPDTSIPITPAKYVQYIGGRFNWQIKNAESFPNMHVIIFDRYSRKLKEYHGYSNSDGWDGTYNGHILPSTDYWYWIKDDNFGIVTGHFLLHYDHKW